MSEKMVKRTRQRPLVRHFGKIRDPRSRQGRRHPQAFVLAVVFTAMASGARGYAAIGEWAAMLPEGALKRLGGRRGKSGKYVAPGRGTIRNVLQSLDPNELNELMRKALHAKREIAVVAVDGKTLRGTRRINQAAKAVLSALDVNTGMVLAQREVSEEHNEIPYFRELLQGLPLKGAVITADALHTQVDHARFLVEEKEADFFFVVKGNQGTLFGELNRWNNDRFGEIITTVEKGHGRIETRSVEVSVVGDRYLPFPHVKQILRIRRMVTDLKGGPMREEVSFGITSLEPESADGERLGKIARSHWAIENELHWVKDQSMGEEYSRIREGATVVACLRSAVLGALRGAGHTNIAKALRSFSWNWRHSFALIGA